MSWSEKTSRENSFEMKNSWNCSGAKEVFLKARDGQFFLYFLVKLAKVFCCEDHISLTATNTYFDKFLFLIFDLFLTVYQTKFSKVEFLKFSQIDTQKLPHFLASMVVHISYFENEMFACLNVIVFLVFHSFQCLARFILMEDINSKTLLY